MFNVKCGQIGMNLTVSRGGVAKAVSDYRDATGGVILSVLGANSPPDTKLEHAEYYTTASGVLNTVSGRLPKSAANKLLSQISETEHIGIHGSFRLTTEYVRRSYRNQSNIRFSYIPHGSLDPWVFKKNRIIKKAWLLYYKSFLFEKSVNVIAATTRELQKIQIISGVRHNQCVIPLPVVLPPLPSEDQRQAARLNLSIPPDARTLLFLGRLHPMKRPLETVKLICETSAPLVYLLVAGPEDGVTHTQLRSVIRRYNATNRIKLIGPAFGKKKHQLLLAADAFISLSHRENFNYAAAESLAHGLPLIISPGNDLSWDLKSSNSCWLLPKMTEKCAQEAISSFATSHPIQLSKMGNSGRRWADDNLNPDLFSARVQAAFSK